MPASRFPVGGVLAVAGRLVPAVNVEPHADPARAEWTHVLCAERNALGTACSYGLLGAGAADDPEAKRQELIDEYREEYANPYTAADRGFLDDVIEPGDTRARLQDDLEMLASKRASPPQKAHGNIPL